MDRATFFYLDTYGVSMRLDIIREVIIMERIFINCIIFTSKNYLYAAIVKESINKFDIVFIQQVTSSRLVNYSIQVVEPSHVMYVNLIYEKENTI